MVDLVVFLELNDDVYRDVSCLALFKAVLVERVVGSFPACSFVPSDSAVPPLAL